MSAILPDLVLYAPGALPARPGHAGPAPTSPNRLETWRPDTSPQKHFLRAQVGARGSIVPRLAGVPAADRWLLDLARAAPAMSLQAFSAWTYGVTPPCLLLVPVHLHVGRDHLMLLDPTTLAIDASAAETLAQLADTLFDQAGETLRTPDPRYWFIATPAGAPALQCRSWQIAMSRSIEPFLPTGADARSWRKVVNELQMIWFEHPHNVRREADGLPAVNSVWLEGVCVDTPQLRAIDVVSDQPCLQGLALAGGAQADPAGKRLPDLQTVLASRARNSRPLLIDLDAWRLPALRGDEQGWWSAWEEFALWCDQQRVRDLPQQHAMRCRLLLSNEDDWLELDLDQRPAWQFWRRLHLGEVLRRPVHTEPA